MSAMRIQFLFLQQTAAGRRKIAKVEQEQLAGAGRSGMLASMTKAHWTSTSPSCRLLAASLAASMVHSHCGANAQILNKKVRDSIETFKTQCYIPEISERSTPSQKVPTFKLSVTLSNLNWFLKCLHYSKVYEICYKPMWHYPHHLRHVVKPENMVKPPWEIKILFFCRYSAVMEENAYKLHFKCTDSNSSTRVTVYAECIYVFLSKSCSHRWIPRWLLLTNSAVTSAVTSF